MTSNTRTEKRLSDKDLSTITNGLSVAAERFDEHVVQFGEVAKALRAGEKIPLWAEGEHGARGAEGLADTFRQQAEDSRRLMELLNEASDVVVTTDPDDEG